MPDFQENTDFGKNHKHNNICDEVNRRIYAFIDGRMDIAELKEYQEHINQCVSCQTLVQFEKKLIQIIHKKGGYTQTEIPATLIEKIRKALDLHEDSKT